MSYDIIDSLLDPGVTSKVDLVKYLIERAKNRKSNEEYNDLFFEYIVEKEKIQYYESYRLIGPKYALGCLISNFLYLYTSTNTDRQINLLTDLLDYIKGFQPSKNPMLKQTEAVKLIDLLSEFGLPNSFLVDRNNFKPLKIYIIPYKHSNANALYFPNLNTIASYRPKTKSTPEYIFMHEIGHLLTFNLTGDATKVPDSFIEFNREFNPTWKGDLVEIFVDLFSIAVMMETEYATKNPFSTSFSIESQKIIKEYFVELISNYSKLYSQVP